MVQRRSGGWIGEILRKPGRPWLLGGCCVVLAVVLLWAVVGHGGGRSFALERGSSEESQVVHETQLEGENESFEQFEQSSSNIQVDLSTQVEDSQVTTIIVDVDGAVESPGVYELEGEGARVNDAVRAAGGLTEDADTARVNLAAWVEDGAKVYIPRQGEDVPEGAANVGPDAASDAEAGSQGGERALININTATSEELQRLPGVGEATASAIVEDRERNGAYTSVEDIMRVSGIGEKKFEKMRDMICV